MARDLASLGDLAGLVAEGAGESGGGVGLGHGGVIT
jgi:hypothetical protein